MGKLKYLVTHCTDTPPELPVFPSDLEEWHKGPKDLEDGRVKFMGRIFDDRSVLPDVSINGKHIREINGRGWDRLGYSDMILRNGEIINLTPYDKNNEIEAHEMTWGVSGINSISRHIVLVGGWHNGERNLITDFFDIFTEEQFVKYSSYVLQFIRNYPDAEVTGHNDHTSKKTCPNFDVKRFLSTIDSKKWKKYRGY